MSILVSISILIKLASSLVQNSGIGFSLVNLRINTTRQSHNPLFVFWLCEYGNHLKLWSVGKVSPSYLLVQLWRGSTEVNTLAVLLVLATCDGHLIHVFHWNSISRRVTPSAFHSCCKDAVPAVVTPNSSSPITVSYLASMGTFSFSTKAQFPLQP